MEASHLKHLYSRIGFGLNQMQYQSLLGKSKTEMVSAIFLNSKETTPLTIDLSAYNQYLSMKSMNTGDNEALRKLAKKSRQDIKKFNYAWLERLRDTDQELREKMTLFWANIFVCKDNNVLYVQQYNNILRSHALGNFGDFVKSVAKSAAMSKYLNNKQNRKDSPNENFARELMELFTLGVGNYTEKDIKESARAFTGWAFKKDGSFLLRRKKHDDGIKTFMGVTGNLNGEDIIDIILTQKQCARFICGKIYTYFINPKVDEARLESLTNVFYKDYNIENLMRHIVASDWFYDEKNRGVKIKSPVELLIGIQRIVPVSFQKKKQVLYLQKIMGQTLLDPPNVAGWKQDRYWIDGNTLMVRMKLAALLLNNAIINVDVKGEFEDSFEAYYAQERKKNKFLKVASNWDKFYKAYGSLSHEELKSLLIVSKIDKDTERFLANLSTKDNKEYMIQLMSLPEYQLC
ncbi:DUF1800 domain-containing protein [Lacinutrix chionoecetis]